MRWRRGLFTYRAFLSLTFAIVWVGFAINPTTRQNWLFENVPVALCVLLLLGPLRRVRFSNRSCTFLAIFLLLHIVGAHYNYSEVPFGETLGEWLGDPERNHYDRLVHFCFGLLLVYPFRELLLHAAQVRGFWGYFLPFNVTMCLSALYEIVEWLVVIHVDPEAGAEFLGAQGDVWDSQKDMAMAAVGAALTLSLIALLNWWRAPVAAK